jgi:N-acetylneuraminic acid mutarotase
MKMIRCIPGLIVIFAFLTFPSCHKSNPAVVLGNWVTSTDFGGSPRSGAYCFVIGEKAYVGLGYGGPNNTYLPDSWVFEPGNTRWSKIADFPGTLREQAVAFSLNGKGYVGTGYNRERILPDTYQLKDFWEYNPASNQWKRLGDFGGDARYNAVAFDDGTYGYVGTGYNGNFYSDFWQYNPADDSWKPTAATAKKREQSLIMTINGKIYLCTGTNNGSPLYDLWEFNPATQSWTNQTPLTTDPQYANFKLAVSRYSAVSFTLDGKGYIATGGPSQNSVYQFDPAALTWTKMTPYEGAGRSYAVAFVVAGRAYLTTGQNGNTHFDDMKEFRPLEEYNIND